MSDVVWCQDAAASGRRLRVQIDGWDLLAYEDGRWEVRSMRDPHHVGARGLEPTQDSAVHRCERVREALS